MGQQVGLTHCINPAHDDSTPSMAVYDHGKGKLQVFCFGCQYYGWVDKHEIDVVPPAQGKKNMHLVTEAADHHDLVKEFFLVRNFEVEYIPWGHLSMGDERHTEKLIQRPRPYMEWYLYDQEFNVTGVQRRYLDEETPKTRYLQVNDLPYPRVTWLYRTGNPSVLHIAESWVDGQWLYNGAEDTFKQNVDVLSILGTTAADVKPYLYQWSRYYELGLVLWFDGDEPGINCARKIQRWASDFHLKVTSNIIEGKKVYES